MKKAVALNMRISAQLAADLDARAVEEGRDRSSIVRTALENYLSAPTLPVHQRLTAVERAVVDLQRRLDEITPASSPMTASPDD